ncbi:hypothetical protein SELMODRAFT_429034 [Selaginella moellendorffii]|uniref:NAD-dependent epimerase/dehydratase domain-containing protein n=1 Tax=Selaginella moellendorffii TaxID=88036 RepID=D8T4U8_SELML|nr:probable UDP-arabinose 4-epimerase 2 isoform X1 [Selaginella moellendorffii]EFJ08237.1 hypothetical protein SELMODRAFT_429034 [Selaginella moellendorffii]|eukprot:XP_002990605.1 probable UDP-arabinose 4-epimerase 2 isoform X1 [Selaginella moellendorffii]
MPGSPLTRRRNPHRSQAWSFSGMDYGSSRPRSHLVAKVLVAASLTALCMFILRQSSTSTTDLFAHRQEGVMHVLVTGGAGFIGSHATLRLLADGHRVTIVDNLSRGNMGAVHALEEIANPGMLQFINADLGDRKAVDEIFKKNAIDAVMHFAAVAYVGESVAEPLRYYHNITSNTLTVVEAMTAHNVKKLIYSSTCATYGEPTKMPIVEETEQVPINPYGKAKKMAEDIIKDYTKASSDLAVVILRYFNVIGSDPLGRLGEAPRPELRHMGRISGACFDAALGHIPELKVMGTDYDTKDGTCIRDYIHVTDLVDAHVKALAHASEGTVKVYNVGTGVGVSVKEFVEACKAATGVNVSVSYLERRPGDYAEVYSNPSKIFRELGWKARHTNLTKSLSVAWKWKMAHPNGYGDARSNS